MVLSKLSVVIICAAAFACARIAECGSDYNNGGDGDTIIDRNRECAYKPVTIDDGQQCGGDGTGCCQSRDYMGQQNQWPSCNNPDVSTKPDYCQAMDKPAPWACRDFSCGVGSMCLCGEDRCTCKPRQDYVNTKENPSAALSPYFCKQTSFDSFSKEAIACTGTPKQKKLLDYLEQAPGVGVPWNYPCANASVEIKVGQRCGGDDSGCCQPENIGGKQNQYPRCNNPYPNRKPAYCNNYKSRWAPWDCKLFTCEKDAICTCTNGADCLCTEKRDYENIKDNAPYGYWASRCARTHFADSDWRKIACNNPDMDSCFPAAATVLVRDMATATVISKSMAELIPGDLAQVVLESGQLSFSPVFLLPHRVLSGTHKFVQLRTASNAQMRLTEDHFAYVASGPSAAFVDRTAVAAGKVRSGSYVWRASDGTVVPDLIAGVTNVEDIGIVSPLTLQGTIVVEGIAASVYGNYLGTEGAAKALAGVGRALWRVAPAVVKAIHSLRLAEPISLSVTYALQKNMIKETAVNRFTHWAALRLTGTSGLAATSV